MTPMTLSELYDKARRVAEYVAYYESDPRANRGSERSEFIKRVMHDFERLHRAKVETLIEHAHGHLAANPSILYAQEPDDDAILLHVFELRCRSLAERTWENRGLPPVWTSNWPNHAPPKITRNFKDRSTKALGRVR